MLTPPVLLMYIVSMKAKGIIDLAGIFLMVSVKYTMRKTTLESHSLVQLVVEIVMAY